MGLDMYLSAKRFIGSDDFLPCPEITNTPWVREQLSRFNFLRCQGVEFEAAYWRKANQIHQWFVDNVQGGEDDCKPYGVSFENLEKLVAVCKKVLEHKELAEELLPAQSGFFFGATEYDEYYFQDLEETIRMLQPYLDNKEVLMKEGYDFEYQSSW